MLKVAVIGAGTMGLVHTDAYKKMKDVELTGIVDIRQETGQWLAERQGTSYYSSLEQLLLKENPDVVDICVPTYLHREYVEKAAKAKKHIICETPIARSLEDAKAIIEICEKEGVQLFIANVLRFFPEFKRIQELVNSERIGKVGTVRTMRGGEYPIGWGDWYANVEKSGSLLVDMLVHDFDFLRWCFGEVERVFAKSQLGRDRMRMDHALVGLRFQNGVIAHAEGTWAYPEGFRTEVEIAGEKGIIHHNSDESIPIKAALRKSKASLIGGSPLESPLKTTPHQLELEHFIHCLRTGAKPVSTAEDGLKALEISLAALESVQSGQPVFIKGEL